MDTPTDVSDKIGASHVSSFLRKLADDIDSGKADPIHLSQSRDIEERLEGDEVVELLAKNPTRVSLTYNVAGLPKKV